MNSLEKTALVLIGFQNDYFDPRGALYPEITNAYRVSGVVRNLVTLLNMVGNHFGLVVTTPIHYSQAYEELHNPVGILAAIKEVQAFRAGTFGAETIDALKPFGSIIREVRGKRGFNAFVNTRLDSLLRRHGIDHVLLAGAVTSVCIDSTGRFASELGYKVSILADCTSGRTKFEQDFYCHNVFPLYAEVIDAADIIEGSFRSEKTEASCVDNQLPTAALAAF